MTQQDAFYKLGNAPKSISDGASPRTPLGGLQCSPDPELVGRGLAAPSPRTHPEKNCLKSVYSI